MQSPEDLSHRYLYDFAKTWKKNIIINLCSTLFSFLYFFITLPKIEGIEDPEEAVAALSNFDLILMVVLFGLIIFYIRYLLRMRRLLSNSQKLNPNLKLRYASRLYSLYLVYMLFFFLISYLFILPILFDLIPYGLTIGWIYFLRGYIRDYADQTTDPNQSKALDRSVMAYIIIIGVEIGILVVSLLVGESLFLLVLSILFSLLEIGALFLIANNLAKMFKIYATVPTPTTNSIFSFSPQRHTNPTEESRPSGIPYSQSGFSTAANVPLQDNYYPGESPQADPPVSTSNFSYDKWAKESTKPDEGADFKRCPDCGAKLPSDATMCGMCGALF